MSVPYRLRVERGSNSGQSYTVEGAGATIGRREGNTIVLGDSRVSGQHARIEARDGGLYVTDLGSSNGTRVNGMSVTGSQPLRPGDVLQVGDTELRVEGPPGMGGAPLAAGMGGAGDATVIGGGPPPGAGQRDLTFGMGAAPPPGPGTPPFGSAPPPGPAFGSVPPPGPPAFGSVPPPGPPGWGAPMPPPGPSGPVPVIPPPPTSPIMTRRRSGPPIALLAGGALLLLLLLGGVGAFAFARSKSEPTPTATAMAMSQTPTAAPAATAAASAPASPTAMVAMQPTAAPTAPPAQSTAPPAQPTAPPPPAPTPTAMPMPTATKAPAAPTKPAAPQIKGTAPSGWKVYRANSLPIVLAVPPDWTVQEKQGEVDFTSADGMHYFSILSNGKRNPTANIDTLRDIYYKQVVAPSCTGGVGIDSTYYTDVSGIRFASLNAKCIISGSTLMYYIGAGLNNAVEWDFLIFCPYSEWDQAVKQYFNPIIKTLNIYANP